MFPVVKCVLLFIFLTCSAFCATPNATAEVLLKLSNFALQSRQRVPNPYSYKYPGKYPSYYQNYPHTQYPGSNYLSYGKPYKPHYQGSYDPSSPSHYPSILNHLQKPKESIMEVLYSIAKNDDLRCVPKLICEVTSGTISGRQQGLNLPINLNMESLLSFLSTLNGAQSSPLLYFGKAALLGFSSKGNTGSCTYAYPECPSDPERVVKYLNNHNGGFFRFFNAANPHIPYRAKALAQQRIQNNAVDYVPNSIRYQNSVTFPKEDQEDNFRSEKTLRFPNNDFIYNSIKQDATDLSFHSDNLKFPNDENYEQFTRKPNYDSGLDFQKPLPNHKVTPVIFPVRTGTGDLRLDPEELQDYARPIAYQDDDVRVIFNGASHEDLGYDAQRYRKGRGFSFPL